MFACGTSASRDHSARKGACAHRNAKKAGANSYLASRAQAGRRGRRRIASLDASATLNGFTPCGAHGSPRTVPPGAKVGHHCDPHPGPHLAPR
eukprot:6701610-Prymnesium_polylepis.1